MNDAARDMSGYEFCPGPDWGPVQDRPQKPKLTLISAADFAGKPIPRREWHVENLIPKRNVTGISGDGSVGKTLLALQLAAATVTGTSWIGQLPEQGGVIVVTAEDEVDELHRRLADIVKGQGLQMHALMNLRLISLAGMDALLAIPEGRSDHMKPTPLFESVEDAVMTYRPALVIVDPLADVFGGDEVRKTQARQFVGMLRGLAVRADTSVVLLSHPSQAGMASGHGTSGNVAWNNSLRSRLYFEHAKRDVDGPADSDARVLTLKKSNYGPPTMTINLRWSEGHFVLDGGTAAFGTSPDEVDRIFLHLIAKVRDEGRNVTSIQGTTFAPKIFSQHPDRRGIKKDEFQKAMERLFSTGRIKLVTDGPPSRQRSRIVIVEDD